MIIKITNYDEYESKQAHVEFLDVVDASKEIASFTNAEVKPAIGANRIDVRFDDDRDDIIYISDNFRDFDFMRVCSKIKKLKIS